MHFGFIPEKVSLSTADSISESVSVDTSLASNLNTISVATNSDIDITSSINRAPSINESSSVTTPDNVDVTSSISTADNFTETSSVSTDEDF